jgi:hypothetical protein
VKNPTANAICERVHLTIGNVLRTMIHTSPPQDTGQASDLIDQCLATAMHATRATAHKSLNNLSPGALVFQRDMYLDIPLIADIMAITNQREATVNSTLMKVNQHRLTYDYKVGEQVLVKAYNPDKLEARWLGPYAIEQVHVNGTLTIRKTPMVAVTDRISIRWLKPYRS